MSRAGKQIGVVRFQLQEDDALETLYENIQLSLGTPRGLFNNGFGTDRVEVFQGRFFRLGVPLRDNQDRLVFGLERSLHSRDRATSADGQGHQDAVNAIPGCVPEKK